MVIAAVCGIIFLGLFLPCLVPERWLICELSGAGSDLAKLPPGPREERRGDVVRSAFTGEEIDAGAVENHFLAVAGALRSRGYR